MSSNFSKQQALKISTIFGIVILILDFIQYIFSPDSISNPQSTWVNVKYLIWAIGVFYALKWYHLQEPNRKFLSYLGFITYIAVFVSLFDIFFTMLYYNLLNPGAKTVLINYLFQYNPQLSNYPANLKEQMQQYFSFIYGTSLFLSYIIIFLFYSVFYVLFLKLFVKTKNL